MLKKFQALEGLTSDGIYDVASRNRIAAKVGVSSKGFIRVVSPAGGNYLNYNDTTSGISGDSTYRLDPSWVTTATRNSIVNIANTFFAATTKKLEVNDCSLINGTITPEHSSHRDGKDVDLRNAGITTTQQKAFLEACLANANVEHILYYTKHGLTSNKINIDACHSNHFHVDFIN